MKNIIKWLDRNANSENYLFGFHDLRALYPDLSNNAFKALLSRAVRGGHLERLCRGIFCYKRHANPTGLILFHVAALLRANEFNYISLETVLSDAGVISQIPMDRIYIMSSGRSNVIFCENYGTIEFVHTNQKPNDIMHKLIYDKNCRLWRATVPLAIRDMKATHRNSDLIDWEIANEFI
jgi:predicted transcriptional regulator of viral defense system